MALYKYDPRNTPVGQGVDEVSCRNGADCMFLVNGACSAESCVFNELPSISGSKELSCSVCGKVTKSFSAYSGISSFICSDCEKKIKKITPDKKYCSVCKSNEIDLDQTICSDCQEKIIKIIKDSSCPICGTSLSLGETMCANCAQKIREKLNE